MPIMPSEIATDDPDASIALRGHSTNLVGVPTGLLASVAFNDFPLPLCISGTREAHRSLFERLNTLSDPHEAGRIFQDYMALVFDLDHMAEKNERRRFRASYIRLLKDWGFDSNTPAAAVLKGWVESRFGLFPTFHKAPIRRFNSPQWIDYTVEKVGRLTIMRSTCNWICCMSSANGCCCASTRPARSTCCCIAAPTICASSN